MRFSDTPLRCHDEPEGQHSVRSGGVTCRDEVLAAFDRLRAAGSRVDFTANDIVSEMHRVGTTYRLSTIRTHLSAHMVEDGSLVRSGRGTYRLTRDRSADMPATVMARAAMPRPRRDPGPNGAAQLEAVLRRAGYESTVHAVAAHTIMLDPLVVGQTRGQGVFRTVRRDPRLNGQVGSFGELNGGPVMFDDNLSAIAAFTWAAGHGRGVDMQFNHIWSSSRDPNSYTALWNICATPAFLAKTTDGSNHPEVVAALRWRAFTLYDTAPVAEAAPVPPHMYESLRWAPFPAAVSDLEQAYREAMATKPKDRVVTSCQRIGWMFSGFEPDDSL